MTVDLKPEVPIYTVAGTGPYGVPFGFASPGDVGLWTWLDDGTLMLVPPEDYSVTPGAPNGTGFDGGAIHLAAEVASALAGRQIQPVRRTPVEQGWGAAPTSSRERGLELQLDRLARGLQEVRHGGGDRSLRLTDPVRPFVPQPNRVIIFDADGQPVPGPDGAAIEHAEEWGRRAEQAADRASQFADAPLYLLSQTAQHYTFLVNPNRAFVLGDGPGPYPSLILELHNA